MTAVGGEIGPVLEAVERKLDELEGTLRILLALRLLRDGRAKDWPDAVALAGQVIRDPRAYLPEAAD